MHVDIYGAGNRGEYYIENNIFDGDGSPPIGKTSMSIAIEGHASFFIYDNVISGSDIGIFVRNANVGYRFQNRIWCNDTIKGSRWGLFLNGNNHLLKLLSNHINGLENVTKADMLISGATNHPGEIFRSQGDGDASAGNCFEHIGDDILTFGSTISFDYYADSDADTCQTPTKQGNYVVRPVEANPKPCSPRDSLQGNPPYDSSDLASQDSLISLLKDTLEKYPDSIEFQVKLFEAKDEKAIIIDYLIKENLDNGDYDLAEEILEDQVEYEYKLMHYGLLVNRGAYSQADTLLSTFPDSTQDLSWFIQVQEINLDRLDSDTIFQTSEAQDSLLNLVATSESPVRGYARSLLSLLKDSVYIHDFTEPVSGSSRPVLVLPSKIKELPQLIVKIYPNPATRVLYFAFDKGLFKDSYSIQIFDLLGRSILKRDFLNAHFFELDVGRFPMGIYSVQIIMDNDSIICEKVVLGQ